MSRRAPNPAADRAAKNQQTIKGLLKLEGNKSCADCKRNKRTLAPESTLPITPFSQDTDPRPTDPRWASWNLGIFVCIRYAFYIEMDCSSTTILTTAPDALEFIVAWERTLVESSRSIWMPGPMSSWRALWLGETRVQTSTRNCSQNLERDWLLIGY